MSDDLHPLRLWAMRQSTEDLRTLQTKTAIALNAAKDPAVKELLRRDYNDLTSELVLRETRRLQEDTREARKPVEERKGLILVLAFGFLFSAACISAYVVLYLKDLLP